MKKFLVAIIAIMYMGVSSGIAMEIHYCMGKKTGIEFYGDQKDKCGKCGMSAKKSGCCNDEHKFIKLNDSYKNVSNEMVFGVPELAILNSYHLPEKEFWYDAASQAVLNHSPPDYTGPAARILNGVFRL